MTIGLSSVLRIVKPGVLLHWCEGCGKGHAIDIHERNADGHVLGWNGDPHSPSIGETVRHVEGPSVCEYKLSGGVLAYTENCTHAFRGRIVHLKEYPL